MNRLPLRDIPNARLLRHASAALTAFILCTSIARPQDVTEQSLKAAFVYNFARFTNWPADVLPPSASIVACVVGDLRFADALERTVEGKQASGHSITVLRVPLDASLRSCQLLYVSGVTSAEITSIVAAVQGEPVLTVGDADDFGRLGGIAHLFVEENRMRFDVNLARARGSRVQLSSKLLVLAAHILKDEGAPSR